MAVNSVASGAAVTHTAPLKQAQPVQSQVQAHKPAEKVTPAPPPPQQPLQTAPTVNSSGQRIGTTISTSA